MHVLKFWFPGRFRPGPRLRPSLNLAKKARPKSAEAEARPGGPAGRLTSPVLGDHQNVNFYGSLILTDRSFDRFSDPTYFWIDHETILFF